MNDLLWKSDAPPENASGFTAALPHGYGLSLSGVTPGSRSPVAASLYREDADGRTVLQRATLPPSIGVGTAKNAAEDMAIAYFKANGETECLKVFEPENGRPFIRGNPWSAYGPADCLFMAFSDGFILKILDFGHAGHVTAMLERDGICLMRKEIERFLEPAYRRRIAVDAVLDFFSERARMYKALAKSAKICKEALEART